MVRSRTPLYSCWAHVWSIGAPECHLKDVKTRLTEEDVDPGIDIWSLGCIYSVTATWIVYGPDMVFEYANQRRKQYKLIRGIDHEDCFYDGGSVLPLVLEHHDEVKRCLRNNDRMTGPILGDIVRKMLSKSEGRPSAKNVLTWSRYILRWSAATKRGTKSTVKQGLSSNDVTVEDSTGRPKLQVHTGGDMTHDEPYSVPAASQDIFDEREEEEGTEGVEPDHRIGSAEVEINDS